MAEISKVLTAAQVAARLGISTTAVHALANRGTLTGFYRFGRRLWTMEEVGRYLADEAAQGRRRKPVPRQLGLDLDSGGELPAGGTDDTRRARGFGF